MLRSVPVAEMADVVEVHEQRRSCLRRAALELGAELPTSTLHRTIVELARDVVQARHGSLVVVDREGSVSDVLTSRVAFERRGIEGLDPRSGVLGDLLAHRRPIRLGLLDDDPVLSTLPREHASTSFLGVPLVLGERVLGALCMSQAVAAGGFADEDEDLLVVFAVQAALALEAAQLRREAKIGEPAFHAVKEVAQALLEGWQTDDVLALLVSRARRLLGASFASIATPVPRSGSMVLRAADAEDGADLRGRQFATEGSIAAHVMRTRRPLVVDPASDRRFREQLMEVDDLGAAVILPLIVGDHVYGTLRLVAELGDRAFTAEELVLAQAFAAEAAVALEYGQIRTDLSRLALLEERERIAMELHDGVVQSLFVAGLSLQAAEAVVDDPDEIRQRLGGAVASIDGVISDLRSYIFGLRPSDLGDRHLERALRELVESVGRSASVETSIELDPQAARALASRAATILQAAREATSNAVRHSDARSLLLRFCVCDDGVVLEIIDDGHGFDPDAQDGRGHGLGNLKARAESLGGSLEIDSAPGHGTTVRIRVGT